MLPDGFRLTQTLARNHKMSERTTARIIPPWLARSLALGLCLLPSAVLAALLWRDAVNVPYWDEWDDDIGGLFVKLKTGQLTFGDLWAQHNESRFVLSRIFFLLLGSFTHWNIGYEIATTFLLACAVAGAVFWLGRSAFAGQPVARWAFFFISSLLIFSPAQSDAWLWGMEMILYVPLVCILFSLLVLRSKAAETAKWLSCAALATVGTYSFSNGLLVWIVLFPVMFLAEGFAGFQKKIRAALCWLLVFLGNVIVYFRGYQFPPHGFWQMLWANPWPVARYFFVFLGGPLVDRHSAHCLATATIIGLMVVILFAATCLCLFRWRKHPVLIGLAWPWLAVGGYGILSALLATTGRSALGAEQALSPRYGIFGISVMVALVHLVPLLAFHRPVKNDLGKSNSFMKTNFALATLGAVVILLHASAFPANVFNLSMFRLDMLFAKANLQFLDVLPPQPAATKFLFPDYARLKKNADALNRLGARDDDLLKTTRLADFKLNLQSICGSVESMQAGGGNIYISGWAMSPSHKTAADCVLFTYESQGIEPVIFGLMDERVGRPDLAAKFHGPVHIADGWEKIIRAQDLPQGVLTLKAWAYDVQTRQLMPLQTEMRLDNK